MIYNYYSTKKETIMKTIFSRLCLVLSIMLPQFVHPASIDSLQGSYTSLPQELKSLSLLDGAIALKTDMIRRAYSVSPSSHINHEAIKLIRKLFYIIPASGHFGLTKQLNYTNLVEILIINLVYRYLKQEIAKVDQIQLGLGNEFKPLDRYTHQELFKKASPEATRLTILAALWYYKSNIEDFDYEDLLQKILLTACEKLLQKERLPRAVLEKIKELKTAAASIKNKSLEIPIDETSPSIDYEAISIQALKDLNAADKHVDALEQVYRAKIEINGQKCRPFADCFETLIRNLLNIFAYDQNAQKISPEAITQPNKAPNARQELLDFYKQYNHFVLLPTPKTSKNPSPEEIAAVNKAQEVNSHSQKSKAAYNAWAKLLSSIPGALYVQKSPEGIQKDFELEPTFANLIIVTNHLLGLNWFPAQMHYPTEKELSAFIQTHLPKFIALFGSSKNKPKKLIEHGNLTINHPDGYSFFIELSDRHGYMEYLKNEIKLPKILNSNDFKKYPSLWLLAPIAKWPNNEVPNSAFYLFAHPIDKQNFVRKLPGSISPITYPLFTLIDERINTLLSYSDNGKLMAQIVLYSRIAKTKIGQNKISPLLDAVITIKNQASFDYREQEQVEKLALTIGGMILSQLEQQDPLNQNYSNALRYSEEFYSPNYPCCREQILKIYQEILSNKKLRQPSALINHVLNIAKMSTSTFFDSEESLVLTLYSNILENPFTKKETIAQITKNLLDGMASNKIPYFCKKQTKDLVEKLINIIKDDYTMITLISDTAYKLLTYPPRMQNIEAANILFSKMLPIKNNEYTLKKVHKYLTSKNLYGNNDTKTKLKYAVKLIKLSSKETHLKTAAELAYRYSKKAKYQKQVQVILSNLATKGYNCAPLFSAETQHKKYLAQTTAQCTRQ